MTIPYKPNIITDLDVRITVNQLLHFDTLLYGFVRIFFKDQIPVIQYQEE